MNETNKQKKNTNHTDAMLKTYLKLIKHRQSFTQYWLINKKTKYFFAY